MSWVMEKVKHLLRVPRSIGSTLPGLAGADTNPVPRLGFSCFTRRSDATRPLFLSII
jgi:hypothetical protein